MAKYFKVRSDSSTRIVIVSTEWRRANLLRSCSNPQTSFAQNGRRMLGNERRSKVLAKLANARCELEDALNLSILVARYPVVIPEPGTQQAVIHA